MLDAMVCPSAKSPAFVRLSTNADLSAECFAYQKFSSRGACGVRPPWMSVRLQWAANVLDIESTLARVCQRVLGDPAAGGGVRRARALALRELGRIFRATKVRSVGNCMKAASALALPELAKDCSPACGTPACSHVLLLEAFQWTI